MQIKKDEDVENGEISSLNKYFQRIFFLWELNKVEDVAKCRNFVLWKDKNCLCLEKNKDVGKCKNFVL